MYTRNEDIAATEQALGVPLVCEMEYEITPGEFDMVKSSMHAGRAHDVTMFIRDGGNPDQIAVIRKPFFPEGAFASPGKRPASTSPSRVTSSASTSSSRRMGA
jgi:hypothetical protein